MTRRSRAASRPPARDGPSGPGPAPAAGTPAGTASALRPLLLPEAATYSQQTVPENGGMIRTSFTCDDESFMLHADSAGPFSVETTDCLHSVIAADRRWMAATALSVCGWLTACPSAARTTRDGRGSRLDDTAGPGASCP